MKSNRSSQQPPSTQATVPYNITQINTFPPNNRLTHVTFPSASVLKGFEAELQTQVSAVPTHILGGQWRNQDKMRGRGGTDILIRRERGSSTLEALTAFSNRSSETCAKLVLVQTSPFRERVGGCQCDGEEGGDQDEELHSVCFGGVACCYHSIKFGNRMG